MLTVLQTALEVGLIYGLVALALFISFSILNIADLSTDGCFTLGCAVGAMLTIAGHPILALFAAMAAGMLSGYVTAFLQTRLGVESILAGIISNTGLYTINLAVMGFSSNVSITGVDTVFSLFKGLVGGQWSRLILLALIAAVLVLVLIRFFGTSIGLSIRATGDSLDMVSASSINPKATITIGLCLANALTALSGCLIGEYNKFCDINLGTGMVTIALASLIIGEVFAGRRGSVGKRVVCVVLGSIVYRFIIALALRLNISAEYFKLVSAVIVAVAIAAPNMKDYVHLAKIKSNARKLRALSGKGDETDASHISKTFNAGTVNEKRALSDLSLRLADGEFATIVGSNGAGKSTLFNAIAGVFYVDAGTITLDGRDITFLPSHKRSRRIGHLFQDPLKGTAPHMTIEENLAVAYLRSPEKHKSFRRVTRRDRDFFRDALAQLDMGLEDRMNTPVGLLSGGQRQALTLLMATMVTPELLLLDEHTAALDPVTADKVLALTRSVVSERSISCLMITHNMHQALELGTRTLMMDAGRIVLDVSGPERADMTVQGLLDAFAAKAGEAFDNDRVLLSTAEDREN